MKLTCVAVILALLHSVSYGQVKTFQKSAGMTVSFPWVNNYSYYDYNSKEAASKFGFVGIGFSLFFKQSKNKFSINYGMTSDFPFIVPAPIEYVSDSPRTTINSHFIDAILAHNFNKKFNAIGGVNLVNYQFNFISYTNSASSYVKNNPCFGLTIGLEYQLWSNSSVAILYRPGLAPSSENIYRHIITLDARFDINFWKE